MSVLAKITLLATAFLTLPVQSFEPAKLQTGHIKGVKLMTAAAGMVITEITVDARGAVTAASPVKEVSPFTGLVKDSVMSWRFEAARANRERQESRVLVIGLYRPPALLFPLPEAPARAQYEATKEVPFPIELAVPPYPPNAIGSASILVELEVDETGAVSAANTIGPETGFDSSGTETARQWKFTPAERDGRPVRSIVYMIISFRAPL